MTPQHHDLPMLWRGTSTGWQGDYEVEERRYACTVCRSTASVTVREFVGPPEFTDQMNIQGSEQVTDL